VIVLDTTVLVYAVGVEHPYQAPCRELMDAIASGRLRASTTVEAVQEFAHVRARRRDRDDAGRLAEAYADLLSPLLTCTEADLRAGLRLWRATAGIGAFDAVLAATAQAAGASALVSADAGFSRVPALRHLLPDAEAVRALVEE
jgi:uncharacterized protein